MHFKNKDRPICKGSNCNVKPAGMLHACNVCINIHVVSEAYELLIV